jgi:hypothetical protein
VQDARRGRAKRPEDFVRAVNDGEIELVLEPDGHIEAVRHDLQPPSEKVADESAMETANADEDPDLIAANRAEIARLKTMRIGAVNDLCDALGPWRYVLPATVIAGTAAAGLTRVLAPIAWLLLGVLLAVPMALMAIQLERRARSPEAQRVREAFGAQRPRLTPRRILQGVLAAFDRLNVDDTELEDALEPLYEHGNKMDNGFYPARR